MKTIKRILYTLLVLMMGWVLWSVFSHRMPWQKTKDYPHGLKILTYNTRAMLIGESLDQKKAMLKHIAELDADIVCMQEVLVYKSGKRMTLPALREMMKDYPYTYYDFKVYNSYRQFGNVVFSRYPLINKQTIRYQSDKNISSQCDVVVGSDTLRLMVNHLESFGLNRQDFSRDSLTAGNLKDSSLGKKLSQASQLRRKQVWAVRKAAWQSPYPVVAVGDFNALPLSLVYWTMNLGMRDCFAESSLGQYGATYKSYWPGIRIDYIFCSRSLHPTDCHVDRKKYSDHYPLVAEIGWK